MYVWDAASGKLLREISDAPETVVQYVATKAAFSLSFSPDGKLLAGGFLENVCLWDLPSSTKRIRSCFKAARSTEPVRTLQFSADSHWLVSGSSDGEIHIWDVGTRRMAYRLPDQPQVEDVAFRPDGHLLAIAGRGLTLWDAATQKLTLVTPLERWPGSADPNDATWEKVVTSVAWSPDGRNLALGFWDAANTLKVLQISHEK